MEYKEFLEQTIKKCKNKAEFCRALDKKPTGGNYKTIDNIIRKYNLDTSHFIKQPWNKNICYRNTQRSLDEILVENSPHLNSISLKRRLISVGYKEHKCEKCGYEEKVELHHINGNSSDNRLENLQILCPNCHSKTENYRGKGRIHNNPKDLIIEGEELRIREEARKLSNRKHIGIREAEELIRNSPNKSITDFTTNKRKLENKICPMCKKEFHPKSFEQIYCSSKCVKLKQSENIPSKEILLNTIIELNANFTQIGKRFNVTDNAVRKWCKKYNLPNHKKEMLEYLQNII